MAQHPIRLGRNHLSLILTNRLFQNTRPNICQSSKSSFSSPSYNPGIENILKKNSTKSWQRNAQLIKNTDIQNDYLHHMRDLHDPTLHLKTLEDEIKGTMGKALGKQAQKVMSAILSMQQERELYRRLISSSSSSSYPKQDLSQCIQRHNHFREKAKTARWELIVHRQAVGFIIDNHKIVCDKFPVPPPLSFPHELDPTYSSSQVTKDFSSPDQQETPDNYYGQLRWWQRIGRWK